MPRRLLLRSRSRKMMSKKSKRTKKFKSVVRKSRKNNNTKRGGCWLGDMLWTRSDPEQNSKKKVKKLMTPHKQNLKVFSNQLSRQNFQSLHI